ncbi:MAG: hypothetical protein ACD_46C00338G0001 [uncultured bacterium]|nr:MAG: hypothetical protein ACD_46C00338G0001 [uncultured bacterium]
MKTKSRETQEIVYESETTANKTQQYARKNLEELFVSTPLPLSDLLFNLGLFTRSSLLVKYIVMHEVYQRFVNLPGLIVEFGTWWGQNLVLLENLRAIHEPFNKQRHIIGFDTFTGYTPSSSPKDKLSLAWQEQSYATGECYKSTLEKLLKAHEECNVLGHLHGMHQLIAGDITVTAPAYFAEHQHSLVAFSYFDIGLYEPTKAAMLAIKPHLMPGSILLLDELTWSDAPGEALAFKEVFQDTQHTIEKCKYYPSKSIVTIHG